MKIDRPLLDKLAHLSRLQIAEGEAASLMADLNGILAWVEKLNEVDTTGVQPLTSMTQEINQGRADVNKGHLPREVALALAPDHDDQYFKVPKVLD